MDVSLGQEVGYSIRSVRMRSATLGNEKWTYPWVRRLATQLGQYACAVQHKAKLNGRIPGVRRLATQLGQYACAEQHKQ
jgi:hypothetical protein